jgi:hypothetical protein
MVRRQSFRSSLYRFARFLGDLQAISRGPRGVAKRMERRALGRVAGRFINRLVGK